MKIYTSYFAQTKKLEELNIQPISVALYTPDWFLNPIMLCLSQPYNLLNFIKFDKEKLLETQKQYSIKYIDLVLKKQDPQHIYNLIENWSCGKDVALCCFETPGDFCHRHLIAAWLNKHLDLKITEYNFK